VVADEAVDGISGRSDAKWSADARCEKLLRLLFPPGSTKQSSSSPPPPQPIERLVMTRTSNPATSAAAGGKSHGRPTRPSPFLGTRAFRNHPTMPARKQLQRLQRSGVVVGSRCATGGPFLGPCGSTDEAAASVVRGGATAARPVFGAGFTACGPSHHDSGVSRRGSTFVKPDDLDRTRTVRAAEETGPRSGASVTTRSSGSRRYGLCRDNRPRPKTRPRRP